MSKRLPLTLVLLLVLALALTAAGCAGGQEAGQEEEQEPETAEQEVAFPTKELTLICPWAAGGGTDTVSRVLAKQAEQFFGKSVMVVNKTGGGGAVGHTEGMKATPDGHTVTMVTVELVILPWVRDVPFTFEDYKPVMRVNFDPAAITVRADAPWDTIEEFLEDAKKNPGKFRSSGTGTGGIWHMATAAVEKATGAKFTWIPSEGMAPAVTNLLGGHLEFVSGSPAEVQAQVEAGNLKILAVMSDERVPNFPDVPTLKEKGIDVVIGAWRGLAVPKDTPDEVVKILHDNFKKAYDTKEFKETMDKLGLGMAYLPTEEFGDFMKKSSEDFKELTKAVGLAK